MKEINWGYVLEGPVVHAGDTHGMASQLARELDDRLNAEPHLRDEPARIKSFLEDERRLLEEQIRFHEKWLPLLPTERLIQSLKWRQLGTALMLSRLAEEGVN